MQDPDYIIVGAGSAGAGLAYQLARDGRRKILLLEAGPSHRHPFVSMPKGIGKILASERHTWRYEVDNDDSDAPEHWVRGRLLGGSSAINGMMYFRGQKADYDDWAEAGATGWDGEELRKSTGGEIIAVPTDTTSKQSVEALVAAAVEKFGAVHILVNCAAAPGGLVRNAIELADEDALMLDLNTKLFGYFRTSKACVPHMRKAGWGRIVNVGGLTARCTEALSGMRNTALVHFTKTLSDEVGRDGITVNIIHPGVTRTEHIEEWFAEMAAEEGTTFDAIVAREAGDPAALKRMLEVHEVADPIVFLCSQLGSGITGESIAVDGGLSRAVFL